MNSKVLSTSQPCDCPHSVWAHLEKSSDSRDLNDLKVSLHFRFLNKLFQYSICPKNQSKWHKACLQRQVKGDGIDSRLVSGPCTTKSSALHHIPSSHLPKGIFIIIRIIMSAQKDKTQIHPIPYLLKSFLGRLKLGTICILYFFIPFNKVKNYG